MPVTNNDVNELDQVLQEPLSHKRGQLITAPEYTLFVIGAFLSIRQSLARPILCTLASFQREAAIRAKAMQAFESAPLWAVSCILNLQQIAYTADALMCKIIT